MQTKQEVQFVKMHGLGNDVVIINTISQLFKPSSLAITQWADRHMGIGFDQLLILEPANHADFFCRIYNADGGEVEQCGNGLRCVARYLHEEKILEQSNFNLETLAGVFPVTIHDYDHIRIAMGSPQLQQNQIELTAKQSSKTILTSILSLGNPHAIIKVASIDSVMVEQLGAEISTHSHFPEGVNVGFMQIINPSHIRLRTFERGVGETFACGSNACAAACVGIANHWLQTPVHVEFQHGYLSVEWDEHKNNVHMIGPAARVYEGKLKI